MNRLVYCLIIGFLIGSTAYAQSGFHIQVEKTVLPNALTLLTCVDTTVDCVSYQTFIDGGSRDETRAGATGIARIIEMMTYGGTDNIPDYFDAIIPTGATTSSETTEDYIRLSVTTPTVFLRRIMEIEADRVMNFKLTRDRFKAFIPTAKLWRIRTGDNNPPGFLKRELFRNAYRRHTYRHPVNGWESDLNGHLIIQDVFRFDRIFLTPNYTTIVICGNFDPDKVAEWVLEVYGDWKPSLPPTTHARTEGEQRKTITRSFEWPDTLEQKRMMIGYHGPDLNFDTPELVSLEVSSHLLFGNNGVITDRLMAEKLAEVISAEMLARKDPYLFTIEVELPYDADFDTVFSHIKHEISSIHERKIPESQLTRVINMLKIDYKESLQDPERRAEAIGFFQLVGGDYRMVNEYVDILNSLTIDDIMQSISKYIIDKPATVVTLTPEHVEEESQ